MLLPIIILICSNIISVSLSPLLYRWFDKSFSLLLTKNAHAAVNFEHAWGDGVAVLRYFNEVYKDSKVNAQGCQATMEGVASLDFSLTPNLKLAIERARSSVEENCKTLNTNTLQYQKYGKKDIKKFQLSPDALMQLGFQVKMLYSQLVYSL